MPHLENCSHSQDGWCLKCVGELGREREQLLKICELANYPELPDSSPQKAVMDTSKLTWTQSPEGWRASTTDSQGVVTIHYAIIQGEFHPHRIWIDGIEHPYSQDISLGEAFVICGRHWKQSMLNRQELLDSSGNLGLHTLPEYLASPYTPRDAE